MTVSVTTTESSAYAGNGSTTEFSTGFAFDADSWVKVYVYDSAGDRTLKTITTHYTLTGSGTGSAGTVTFLTAPATGETVKIFKVPPYTQTLDLVNGANFDEENVEAALDKLTHLVQYTQSQLNRVLKLTGTSTLTDLEIPDLTGNAGKAMVVNSDGDGYTYATITSSSSVVILDEDDMASNSATGVPSQQSTKAYVDTQVAAASGGLAFISSASVSNNMEIALPSGYTDYLLILRDVGNGGTGGYIECQVSTDALTYDSGAADYDDNTQATADSVYLAPMSTTAFSGIVNIIGARDANAYTSFVINGAATGGSTVVTANNAGARLANQTDVSIKLFPSTGTFGSGTAVLYGYPTS